jgi:transcriptional regulator with XRE-family HTH domain
LIKRARKGHFPRVDDLAEAAGIGRTTAVAVESGRKTVTDSMYNALELALGLPLGTMNRVLRGEIKEFPRPDLSAEGEQESEYEVGGEVFTRSELRILFRALGPDGFRAWLETPTPNGGDLGSTG